jgi:protein SCO1
MVPRSQIGPPGNKGWVIYRPLILVTLTGLLIGILLLWTGVMYRFIRPGAAALDDYGPAPSFHLTDQLGRPIASEELAGKVVLVDFIYTSCTDICPLLSEQMRAVQERLSAATLLGSRVQLISFTVDPARDTPDVLRAYAERYRADPQAWRFVTGPESDITSVIVNGFYVAVQPMPPSLLTPGDAAASGGYEVLHSGRLVLIDREGRIRAYYDTSDLDIDRVVRDIRVLA